VLYWPYDKRIDEYKEIDLIDRDPDGNPTEYNFEGFIVYQFDSPTQPTKWTRIAVFDVVNDVKEIKDWIFDPQRGENIEVTVVKGTDSGIERTIRIKKDYLNDKPLVNGRPYYFAVTAYAYNPYGVPRFYESARNIITVIPKPVSPGTRFTAAVGDTIFATHKSGVSDGEVYGIVVDPSRLTGHKYEVRFEEVAGEITWKLVDVTANQVKLSGQTNQSGDGNYTVVDGVQFKVIGPPPGPKDWAWTKGTRKLTWANADIMTSFGLPEHLFTFNGAFGYISPYGLFVSGHEHSDVVTPDKLRNIRIVFATTDTDGNFDPTHQNASFGYRYMRRHTIYWRDAQSFSGWAVVRDTTQGTYGFQEFGLNGQANVPLAVYDIEANPPRRLAVGFLENLAPSNILADGKYFPGDFNVYDNIGSSGPREWLFIFDVNYSTTQDANLAKNILNNDLPVMYMATWNRRGNVAFSDQDELEIYANHPNTVNDVFEITTPSAPVFSVETAKSDLEKVNAVPNPYFGASPLEKEITEAFITFTRLPKECTVRIFTIAGDLVRTLYKNDDSPYLRWDLRNDAGVPVASGIYIVHIDAPGIGSKVLKVVVFQREERLRYF
jgi:hypothetical protein